MVTQKLQALYSFQHIHCALLVSLQIINGVCVCVFKQKYFIIEKFKENIHYLAK